MKSTGLAALALAVALPAWAQDAKPTEGRIDAYFTWSLVDLASVPAGEGQSVSVNEVLLVITGNEPGPYERLGGRCLFFSRLNGDASGSCQLADADGDRIFEQIEETSGKRHAVITGGTGKFAGITGEHEFTLDVVRLGAGGDAAGRREEDGHLAHVRVVTGQRGRRRAAGPTSREHVNLLPPRSATAACPVHALMH